MGEDNTFALRLKSIRKKRNISMDELVSKMEGKVSKQSISKYENGKMMPDSSTLISLASALDVNVDYFFQPLKYDISSCNIAFRKKAKLGKKKIDSIKEEVAEKINQYLEIEDILDEKKENASFNFFFKTDCKNDAANAAQKLRQAWEIGNESISNIYSLLEEHQIKVLLINGEDMTFDGLSGFADNRYPFVALNAGFLPERIRFSAAHELGHLVLDFDDEFDDKMKEKLCNVFASEFLFPSSVFISLIGEKRRSISILELIELQKEYGLSIYAMIYKAKELGIINENSFNHFCIRYRNDEEFRYKCDAVRFFQPDTSRYKLLVYKALSLGLISTSKANSLLGSDYDELCMEYIFHARNYC